jgi:hypothetical protein
MEAIALKNGNFAPPIQNNRPLAYRIECKLLIIKLLTELFKRFNDDEKVFEPGLGDFGGH